MKRVLTFAFMDSPMSLVRILFVLFMLANATSCQSTYKGLGEFNGPDGTSEEVTPSAAPMGPTLMWSGERYSQNAPSSGMNFDWPVDDARMSRGFLLGKRWHYGVDLASPKGTPILASEDGVVVYVGRGFTGYGKLIVIEHGEKWATLYAHLNAFNVREGEKVKRGQKIGEMGRTGRASGVHLHFEIRYNRQPVNPLMYLPQGY